MQSDDPWFRPFDWCDLGSLAAGCPPAPPVGHIQTRSDRLVSCLAECNNCLDGSVVQDLAIL